MVSKSEHHMEKWWKVKTPDISTDKLDQISLIKHHGFLWDFGEQTPQVSPAQSCAHAHQAGPTGRLAPARCVILI